MKGIEPIRAVRGLDLRQAHGLVRPAPLRLFDARRADIEDCCAHVLETRGRARAPVARRLRTVTLFYRYAEQEGCSSGDLSGRRTHKAVDQSRSRRTARERVQRLRGRSSPAFGGVASMFVVADDVAEATRLVKSLAPGGFPFPIRLPLVDDECRWFLRAVDHEVVRFRESNPNCFRLRKWHTTGPDHFDTPSAGRATYSRSPSARRRG